MHIFKKNWLYDINSILIILITASLGFGVALLLFSNNNDNELYLMFVDYYNRICNFLICFIAIYPAFVGKGICPQMGSDKVYLNTANLPFSKKQLFLQGIGQGFTLLSFTILTSSLIRALLYSANGSFLENFLKFIFGSLFIVACLMIIMSQVIGIIILSLAKKLKWYKTVPAAIIANTLLALFIVLVSTFVPKEVRDNGFAFVFFVISTFSVFCLSVFAVGWKNIENIHN